MIPTRAHDLLCLSIAATLALHAPHLPVWISLPLALLLALRWLQLRQQAKRAPLWLKLPLVGLLLAALLAAYGTPFGRAPGSAMAVGLLVLKLFEVDTARDIRSAVGFCFFVLMSALLFGQGMSFTVLVTLALLPALATLRAIQPTSVTPAWRAESVAVLRSLLLALPLALFAFVFVPRLASPLWGAPSADEGRTGLGDRMAPGDLVELLIDDSPAMRVSFDGPPPPVQQRYFRGWVLARFDGHEWSRSQHQFGTAEDLQTDATVDYRIDLEPTGRHLLPTLDVPLGAPENAAMLANHVVLGRRPVDSVYRYQLRSATRYVLQSQLDTADKARNLALPARADPRARALAADWQRQFDDDPARIAAAALSLFHDGGFSYTLNPAPLGRERVDDFLFSTREGYCEHYASAFTFLMRAAGVPARVVIGYQGGYWSDLGRYLLVRNSDAHAWSEVWLSGRGWVRYDPTAAVRPERVSLGAAAAAGSSAPWYQSGWLQGVRNRWDIVNRWWGQAVVAFNHQRQLGMLTSFGIPDGSWNTLILILAAGCSLLLGLATAVTLWQRPRGDALLVAQRQLEKRLALLGVRRRPQEGPRDFMTRAIQALPAHASQLERLCNRYLYLRYGKAQPGDADVQAYRRQVHEFTRRSVVK